MDYKFLTNLQDELALPDKGILSHVLQKDDYVNVTLFGFSAGEELSSHSAPTPAILYFLEGEANVQLGEDTVAAQARLVHLHASHASPRHSRENSRAYASGPDEVPSRHRPARKTLTDLLLIFLQRKNIGRSADRPMAISDANQSHINAAYIPAAARSLYGSTRLYFTIALGWLVTAVGIPMNRFRSTMAGVVSAGPLFGGGQVALEVFAQETFTNAFELDALSSTTMLLVKCRSWLGTAYSGSEAPLS